jgi:uncharacterized protein YdaU (DUF1376 family)
MGRWYKRCGADFIHGTMMLTLEEKGAYSLCLDLIYDRGGPIPDDARWLAGVCGISLRKWSTIRGRLLSLGKIASENGLISNSRADFEILSSNLSSRERAESGAKGGRKRAENETTANKNNGLAEAELKPKEKRREDKKEGEANASPRGRATGSPMTGSREPWAQTPSPGRSSQPTAMPGQSGLSKASGTTGGAPTGRMPASATGRRRGQTGLLSRTIEMADEPTVWEDINPTASALRREPRSKSLARLAPATSDHFRNELTACLTLVAPVGMTEEARRDWLAVAWATLSHLPADILSLGCKAAREQCDHPSKIVPTIIAETKEMLGWRKDAARNERITDALPKPQVVTAAEAAEILREFGLKPNATG